MKTRLSTVSRLSNFILFFLIILINLTDIQAQDSIAFFNFNDEIVITASRIPTSLPLVARSVIVITAKELKKMPIQSIQGLLQYIPSVDLQQRGPGGIQADLSIRGSTFEQTLLLVNGIKVNDPQTGHHNLNIPYSLADVERVEILKGPGSRIYGPNAFGGVVNIILKEGKTKNFSINLSGGDYQYFQGGVSLELPYKNLYTRFSASKSGSAGYRPSTDFDIFNFSSDISYVQDQNRINFSASYLEKKFGANSFYTSKYPNQWEEIKTLFLQSNWTYQNEKFLFKPILSWRIGEDEFLLKRDDPSFYHNLHKTNVYHAEIQSQYISNNGITTVSLDDNFETISSNNLGEHERNSIGATIEHQFQLEEKAKIIAGISGYSYSNQGTKFWPGVDFIYEFSNALKIHISANKAFRIPTFTELYYTSPANQGNENLYPEVSLSYEMGFNFRYEASQVTAAVFRRLEDRLIDWVLNLTDSIWYAQNLNRAKTNGFEISYKTNPRYFFPENPVTGLSINYTFLDRTLDSNDLISRYLVNYLRHQFITSIEHYLFWPKLLINWKLRYADRVNAENYFLTDVNISYQWKKIHLFLNTTNLFDKDYYEIPSIPMPGRWLKIGVTYKIGLN